MTMTMTPFILDDFECAFELNSSVEIVGLELLGLELLDDESDDESGNESDCDFLFEDANDSVGYCSNLDKVLYDDGEDDTVPFDSVQCSGIVDKTPYMDSVNHHKLELNPSTKNGLHSKPIRNSLASRQITGVLNRAA
jgi:hypothetical protein